MAEAKVVDGSPSTLTTDAVRALGTNPEPQISTRPTPLAYLIEGFRLTTGAPKGADQVDRTPQVLRGVISTIEELARRVRSGDVLTGNKRSSLGGMRAIVPLALTNEMLGATANEYQIEARVSRVQIESLVRGLRVLGYDAIGIEIPSGSKKDSNETAVSYSFLAIRGGFAGLEHLSETTATLQMPSLREVFLGTSTRDGSAGADLPEAAVGAPSVATDPANLTTSDLTARRVFHHTRRNRL